MNTPLNIGGTAAGSVSSTASIAATGANRITLWPRYATYIRNASAPRQTRKFTIAVVRIERIGGMYSGSGREYPRGARAGGTVQRYKCHAGYDALASQHPE